MPHHPFKIKNVLESESPPRCPGRGVLVNFPMKAGAERQQVTLGVKEGLFGTFEKFEEYRAHVQRTMEKPYPDNGGFYGLGCLREAGLRRSRHTGDFRTKSEFVNKEETFRQPLKGHETVLDRGLTIRSSGGTRRPSGAPDDANGDGLWEPSKAQQSAESNIFIIRSVLFVVSPSKKETVRILYLIYAWLQ
jgi:hypothetical protein